MCEARAALPFNAGALPRLLYLKTSNDDRDTPAGQLMWRLEASAAVEVFLNFRSEAHAGKALLACPDRHPLGMCHGLNRPDAMLTGRRLGIAGCAHVRLVRDGDVPERARPYGMQ